MIGNEAKAIDSIDFGGNNSLDYDSIDKLNQICYDKVASEYDLQEHETCRNFEQCTADYLGSFAERNERFKGRAYLDIGVGTGVTLNVLKDWIVANKLNVDVIDISQNMLDISISKFKSIIRNTYRRSVHRLGDKLANYDLVVASMCDPYLTDRFLSEVSQFCSVGGKLVMIFPSVTWISNSNRSSRERNVFNTHNGLLEAFSFSLNPIKLVNILSGFGFELDSRCDYFLSQLQNPSELNREILKSNGNLTFCHAFTFNYARQ